MSLAVPKPFLAVQPLVNQVRGGRCFVFHLAFDFAYSHLLYVGSLYFLVFVASMHVHCLPLKRP